MNLDETIFLGNSVHRWIVAAAVASGLGLVSIILKTFLAAKTEALAKKTDTKLDDLLHLIIKETKSGFLFTFSIYMASHGLVFPEKVHLIISYLFKLAAFLQIGLWGSSAISFGVSEYSSASASDPGKVTTISALSIIAKIIFWVTIFLLLLENLGVNVSAMVAGLGIGGIAIALAVQNVLGDLLASLSIVLDKPFVIGDVIKVDNDTGTVEHIGLKTTRLISSGGEQLIFSNSDILKSRIRNFKRMRERRIKFLLGVTYETSPSTLAKIPDIVTKAVNSVPETRFERCFLFNFGAFSLDFEVSYFVNSPNYDEYAITHHKVSIALLHAFQNEKIEFAYPTQRIVANPSNANAVSAQP